MPWLDSWSGKQITPDPRPHRLGSRTDNELGAFQDSGRVLGTTDKHQGSERRQFVEIFDEPLRAAAMRLGGKVDHVYCHES
jgi:hypothetical protein